MKAAWLILAIATSAGDGSQIPAFADTMAKPDVAETMVRPIENSKIKHRPANKEPSRPTRRRVWIRTGWFGRGHYEWK